jgi:uncharacterized membrane protein
MREARVSRGAWIQLFLFLHVVGAIAAVGPTLTYALWLARAERAGADQRAFTLRTISWVDNHLATPSFMLQAVTGTALVLLAKFRFLHTAWLLAGVAIYVVLTVFAVVAYAPVVKRQVGLAERLADDPDNAGLGAEYQSVAARARAFGITAILLTLAILYFMIVKPTLWSEG